MFCAKCATHNMLSCDPTYSCFFSLSLTSFLLLKFEQEIPELAAIPCHTWIMFPLDGHTLLDPRVSEMVLQTLIRGIKCDLSSAELSPIASCCYGNRFYCLTVDFEASGNSRMMKGDGAIMINMSATLAP